jgi:hypothetical protein
MKMAQQERRVSESNDMKEHKQKEQGVEQAIVRLLHGKATSQEYLEEVKREVREIWSASPRIDTAHL